jgi:hypothetical protein
MQRGLVGVTLIGLCVALAACSSSAGNRPASVQANTSTTNVAKLAIQFYGDLSTESAAASTFSAQDALLTAAIGKLGQRIALDNAAITNDSFGAGCIGSLSADPSTYTNCASSEEQTAANAESDKAVAQGQATQYLSQCGSAAGTLQSALSTFIGQLIALPWPSKYNEAVNTVVSTARTLREVLGEQAAVTFSTPSATVSALDASQSTDIGNFNDAINVLKAELGQPSTAPNIATTTTVPPTTTTTITLPPTTTTTIDPVCEQNAPVDGCPPGTPAAIAWAQQQDQAAQAAQAAQLEQAYEQCVYNDAQADAAAITQQFSGQPPPPGTPTWEPCSTAGLTPAQVQQAQQAEGP